ncbi:bifunctional 4-hydroxy-2-oxoglutarate aldolase/2-dehydro-3-deoxy-phosphogluconate aldolase [Microlunatus elymi]|uniref:Bifunctional 4-hydroxy-2-oxoglutarate aldolase/2-dehydro-3-deoxy-phosphogluconate aldolase n=1 Tax=Microlunatus elymi TaxID=2596828 RepID=A0A516PYW2_9ACTN|nr:bifunctional 4-hydroxy-2-oxoglutarate aldolase/2-dehydro-3-deoxy-phosphogluconate aldolase [Microlunatus elymi]QDP96365.1 bifunctional 4-hydroxy-2-oxoglutarate aldolase/2-dehydro-3-deoxy-phosphogluconate aldolase [Microlunatus elymi]
MSPHEVVRAITDSGIVAIVRADGAKPAVELARRLWSAGTPVVEIALTTPNGIDAIAELAAEVPDGCVLGAGTVLDAATARMAILAGARLLVTPTLDEGVISTAQRYGAATVIGTATPTEMVRAQTLGADLVKVFPASQWTPKTLADVLQALPQLRCVPTGGIAPEQAADWIRAGAVAVGLGSGLTKGDDPSATVAQLLESLRSARG